MLAKNDLGVPTALELVRRSLNVLSAKLHDGGLNPLEEVRYRNLCELESKLVERAS